MDYKKLYEEQMIQNKKLTDKISICEAEQEEEANLYIKVKEENEELQGMLEDTDDDRLIDILGCEHCERVEAVEKLKEEHESLKKDFECYKGKYFLAPECHECGFLLTEDDLFASLDVGAPHFCCEGCREEYEDSDED